MTPRQFADLLDRQERATEEREFLFAQIVQYVVNFSMGRPETPVRAADFMPSEWRKGSFATSQKPKRIRTSRKQRESHADFWRGLCSVKVPHVN